MKDWPGDAAPYTEDAMTLADVLSPLELTDFYEQYLGQSFVVVRGRAGRFHGLLSWQDLGEALNRLRVNDKRVLLVKHPTPILPDSYVHTFPGSGAQYLIGPAVAKYVSAGATLVVNQVDELFPGIRRIAESCERHFQVYTPVNLYAAWRRDNGFDIHWDTHDTLILQLRGRKDWKIWEPTRLHPINNEGLDVTPVPTSEPVWQDVLHDGDVLYMPRGWWHVAYPRDEPSLHVTFGVKLPTGIDLVRRALADVQACPEARMDVPHWMNREQQATWLNALRRACIAALSDDVIDRYMLEQAERAHSRPLVCFPDSAGEASPHISESTPLRLRRGSRLHLQPAMTSRIAFKAGGTEWRCHEALAPALKLLNHVEPCTLADMNRVVESRIKPLVRHFVTALVLADVVWTESLSDASNSTETRSAVTFEATGRTSGPDLRAF